ncbi:MAG TPA: tripartite tricarboxylate transporter substrate binding protein [Burkholderiales bacterium]|jgi:tripartite-type tricarboxylate transporter receptor subunit TctC
MHHRRGPFALAALVALFSLAAHAQSWPTRPVRIIAPYPPGGFTDVVTRKVADEMGRRLKQAVVVENKPGAGTNIGAEAVATAAPDGYTLLMGTSSLAINRTLYGKLNYDAVKDFAPLGVFATTGYTLLANKNLPVNNATELIAYARAHPGQVNFGSSGNGAVNHLAGVLFATMTATKLQHVPYKGSQAAITDLVGGQIQLYWSSTLEAMPMIKADRVKALGVTNKTRVPAVPTLPPLAQAVPGYEVLYWMGLFAPAATPRDIQARLAADLKQAVGSEEMKKYLEASGAEAVSRSPAETAALLKKDIEGWGKTVKESGAHVD